MKTIQAHKAVNNGVKCWRVQVPTDQYETYKVHNRFFPLSEKAKAKEFAEGLNRRRQNWSFQLTALPEQTQGRLLRCLDLAGSIDRLEMLCSGQVAKDESAGVLLTDAIETHASTREASEINANNIRRDLGRLADLNPGAKLASITTKHVNDWLASLAIRYSPTSVRDAYQRARCFFKWALVDVELIERNPMNGVKARKAAKPSKAILTPEQTAELLATCQANDPDLLPLFTLQLFNGVRRCEAERLTPALLSEGHIHITEAVGKKERERLIPILPTAAAWLSINSTLNWDNLRRRRSAILSKLSFRLPDNSMRHSFCTYFTAVNSYGECAKVAGNTEQYLLKNYVVATIKRQTGADHFALTPATVANWQAQHPTSSAELAA